MSSGVELYSEPNSDVLISAQLAATDTGLFPQAVIYEISNLSTAIETIDLDEVGLGAYAKVWTNPGIRTKYWVRIFIYTDAGHTTMSEVDRPAEISINIGRYSGGGYISNKNFGGYAGSSKVITEEEMKKISEMIYEMIKPDIDSVKDELLKKSELTIQDISNEVGIVKDIAKNGYDEIRSDFSSVLSNISASKNKLEELLSSNKYNIDNVTSATRELLNGLDKVNYMSLGIDNYSKSLDSLNKSLDSMKYRSLLDDIKNGNVVGIYYELRNAPIKIRKAVLDFLVKNNPRVISQMSKMS